jgi:hypothetical protein
MTDRWYTDMDKDVPEADTARLATCVECPRCCAANEFEGDCSHEVVECGECEMPFSIPQV